MPHRRLRLIVALLLGFGLTGLQAQESVNATGGNSSGDGGSASYSVGQVVYSTNTGTNGSVTEAVQQPYEISTLTGVEEAKGINLTFSAYPNPTADFLTLNIDASTTLSIESMSYQLYVIDGKLLRSEKITGNTTSIAMSDLAPATYFLKVFRGNKKVKTFKIIRTQ